MNEPFSNQPGAPTHPSPPEPPLPPPPPPPPDFTGFPFDDADAGGAARGGAVGETPGEPDGDGGRRFAIDTRRPPRVVINNFTGRITARGDATAGAIVVRALNRDGAVVPLEDVADVTYDPAGEVTLRIETLANLNRQLRRVRDAVRFSRVDFFDNLGEIVTAVSGLGRDWPAIGFEVTVPARCDLDLASASGALAVEGVEGTLRLRGASGEIGGARLRGNLTAQTASGEIDLDDVSGAVYLRSVSGELKMLGVKGKLVIQTASGDAECRSITGEVGFKSVSGDLALYDGDLTGLYASSTSGDCAIDAVLDPGEYDFRTVSGDIELRVQPDFSALLTGRTVSGSLRGEFPLQHRDGGGAVEDQDEEVAEPTLSMPGLEISESRISMPGLDLEFDGEGRKARRKARRRGRGRWEFLVGDPVVAAQGRTRLRVRTVSGDLAIRARRARPAAPPRDTVFSPAPAPPATRASTPTDDAPSSAPPRAEEESGVRGSSVPGWPETELYPERARRERSRLAILEAVERKELSTEEALRLLRELDQGEGVGR